MDTAISIYNECLVLCEQSGTQSAPTDTILDIRTRLSKLHKLSGNSAAALQFMQEVLQTSKAEGDLLKQAKANYELSSSYEQ